MIDLHGIKQQGAAALRAWRPAALAFALAAVGAFSKNTIGNTIEASVNGTPVNVGAGGVLVAAGDESDIDAAAGAAALGLIQGDGSVVGVGLGVSWAINEIENTVLTVIDAASVTSAGNLSVTALSDAAIDALAIAGAAAVADAESIGGTLGGAGTGVDNTIDNRTEALVRNGSTLSVTGDLSISALDWAKIRALAGPEVSYSCAWGKRSAVLQWGAKEGSYKKA